jgi:hypothetical protein
VLTGAELHPGDLWHDAEDHDNGLLYHRRFWILFGSQLDQLLLRLNLLNCIWLIKCLHIN